jgi:hypothetical protein
LKFCGETREKRQRCRDHHFCAHSGTPIANVSACRFAKAKNRTNPSEITKTDGSSKEKSERACPKDGHGYSFAPDLNQYVPQKSFFHFAFFVSLPVLCYWRCAGVATFQARVPGWEPEPD